MLSYMERVAYPPEYDEPEATKQEVIDVALGRIEADGLGRDRDEILGDTPMALVFDDISQDWEAEDALWKFLADRWGDVPAEIRKIIESRAESTANQEPLWRQQ